MLWTIGEIPFFLLLIIGFALTGECIFRLGRRHRIANTKAGSAHFSALQASVIGLLTLLLGFTFAMAQSRFESRRSLVMQEAQAIGTTFTLSRMLPAPESLQIGGLLSEYVTTRRNLYNAGLDQKRLDEIVSNGDEIQIQLRTAVARIFAEDPQSERTSLLVNALNEMSGTAESRQIALENHVPQAILLVLVLVAICAIGFIAYGNGLEGARRMGSTALFASLIALVLTLILDLDRPVRGFILVSEAGIARLQANMDAELRAGQALRP
jgi:hypothetical protein